MARPDSYQTPAGIAVHPWINKADTKFNDNGVFHTKLILDGALPEVQTLMAKITEKATERFAELTKDLTPAERKKWKLHTSFEPETDDEGEETGRIIFTFKRNWKVRIDGEEKELHVSVYDSMGDDLPGDDIPAIYNGSIIGVAFTMRDVKVPGTKVAGVKLDFFGVQIVKLSQGNRGSVFGRVNQDPDETEPTGYVYKARDKSEPKASAPVGEDDAGSEY